MPFRLDSPDELPDGRLVCRFHGMVICHYCCVDYSFMDEILDEEDENDDDDDFELDNEDLDMSDEISTSINPPRLASGGGPRMAIGRVIPEKFIPPSTTDTPQRLFPPKLVTGPSPSVLRFVNRSNPREALIYTDGACLNNGQENTRAGWGFIFKPSYPVAERLENEGPTGERYKQSSNRAELRAIIGALRFRSWSGESFKSLVIATDSGYVVEGITSHVVGWLLNGWKTSSRADVKNQDLWQALLGEMERCAEDGLSIKFW